LFTYGCFDCLSAWRAMVKRNRQQSWGKFFIRIILPTLLAIVLSIGSIYFILIPTIEKTFLDNKKEMLRELTKVAWGVLVFYAKEEQKGILSRVEAQERALREIKELRYGEEQKDYYWITDLHPRMLMHPYSSDLIGRDLKNYKDSSGKPVFVKMAEIVKEEGSGFVGYLWHTKYETITRSAKLSYVKRFAAWDWVIGTGIYLDDVERKIDEIKGNLVSVVFGLVAVLTLLLIYINHQSLMIEKKRREIEKKLRDSKEKYKKLAGASDNPMAMFFDGRCIYSNKSMWSLLNYSLEEMSLLEPMALFPGNLSKQETGAALLESALIGKFSPEDHRGLLQKKDGEVIEVSMRFSQITFGERLGLALVVRNAGIEEGELLEGRREKYRTILDRFNVAVLRTLPEAPFEIIESNPAAQRIFHAQSEEEVYQTSLLQWLEEAIDGSLLESKLLEAGDLRDMVCLLRKSHGVSEVLSLSMMMVRDGNGNPLYCDCIVEDISVMKKSEKERENLIVELQTSLLFLNQSIKYVLKGFVQCDLHTPVVKAAQVMTKAHLSSILVCSDNKTMVGIVTDVAIRERVIAENLSYDTPVFKVMSSPLIYIDDTALIFEAILVMQEKGVKHLVVRNSSGEVVGVITNEELLHVHRYSTSFMIREISEATDLEEVFEPHERIPRIVKGLLDSGAHITNITRIITTVSDTVLRRLVDFAIEELGPPPCSFTFISLGSEGRGEQTLLTDQDNALIFEDLPEENIVAAQSYFNEFGTKVCTWLDQAGYAFCKGEVMAMNPKWSKPLSQWKEYFSNWVIASGPKDLLEVSIFFDFRCLYGDRRITDRLRDHVCALVEKRAVFLQHLAKNTLAFKAPVDFFGNITVESEGEYVNSFDIKYVIAAIVGFARVYSIKYGLESTNTLQRLDILLEKNVVNKATHGEIVDAYNYLMQMRFRHQLKMISKELPPDNYVNIDELSHMEITMLKKTFSQVSSFQKSLAYDFSVVT
jgi:signal-transduction protein with cAMP-binding, CBS, and nucleotidyltransferase domain/PAS domain-containing protein